MAQRKDLQGLRIFRQGVLWKERCDRGATGKFDGAMLTKAIPAKIERQASQFENWPALPS